MTLRLGTTLMVELTPSSVDGALLTLFLGIAVCWLRLKVPALLRPGARRATVARMHAELVRAALTAALGCEADGD